MADYTEATRKLAESRSTNHRSFDNAALRRHYGLGRVTVAARTAIAEAFEREGFDVLSDPTEEPLVVRRRVVATPKVAPTATPWQVGPAGSTAGSRRADVGTEQGRKPWSRRKRYWALAALLLLLVAGMASDETTQQAASPEPTTEAPPPATTDEETTTEPAQTYADAEQAVDDDDYAQAVVIAAALGDAEGNRIRRAISRKLASRVRAAVRRGDRSAARRLLVQADDYPRTSQLTSARASLAAATNRASARRRAREVAAEQARAQRAAERAAEQAAEEAAEAQRQAQEAAPEPEGGEDYSDVENCSDTSATDFPTPPGDPNGLDGNGDGVACES